MKKVALLLLMMCTLAQAEVRPFLAGDLKKIEALHAGKPFILTLWSASCVHCPTELKALGQLQGKYPGIPVVLLATDSPELAGALEKLAHGYGLGKQMQWVFADPQPEKLRFEIDRRWYGELPRTYFYDHQHHRVGHSGTLPLEQLERWAGEQVK